MTLLAGASFTGPRDEWSFEPLVWNTLDVNKMEWKA